MEPMRKVRLVYVFGLGAYGALGLEKFYKPNASESECSKMQAKRPKRLYTSDRLNQIYDVGCGYGFSIIAGRAVDTDYTAFGFGLNDRSQIGFHRGDPGLPLEIVATPSPIKIQTNTPFTRVACGRSHSVLLSESGEAYTIGNNALGQCGRIVIEKESYFGSKKVHPVHESIPEKIVEVTCGQDHTLFITESRKVYSCGWGADGQTGLGHYGVQDIPAQVKGDIEGVRIAKVSSYGDTVLALSEDGDLFGWGNSEYAQFKSLLNDDSQQFNVPKNLKLKADPTDKIIDIAAGGTMCAFLTSSGRVFVWGFGILGRGPNVDHLSYPSGLPSSLFGSTSATPDVKVAKIYASLSHMAALTNKGNLYMWGKNRYGCLGLSSHRDQYFPWHIQLQASQALKVALGVDHTCVLAEKVI